MLYRVIAKGLHFNGRPCKVGEVIDTARDLLAKHPHKVHPLNERGERVRASAKAPAPTPTPVADDAAND